MEMQQINNVWLQLEAIHSRIGTIQKLGNNVGYTSAKSYTAFMTYVDPNNRNTGQAN